MLATISEFIGHFHPLLVHLPIGFLLAGLFLLFLSSREKYKSLRSSVAIILLWGAIAATLSAITGYLLSISDDYDKGLVSWHQWMGIAVAVIAWVLYLQEKKASRNIGKKLIAIILLVLIFITGHLGGSLTHGSDYLTKPLGNSFQKDSSSSKAIKPLADVQEAFVYSDIIKPILETKCYSCHGANKQKGKLRMDEQQSLMKGGKDGKVIEPGKADQSELIKRLLLPTDNEDHMPPKEKPQPTESQIALLHWWISQGADFTKKAKEIEQPDKIKPILLALQNAPEKKNEWSAIPPGAVEKGDEKIIARLKQKGVIVLPVAQNNNYLSANFVTHAKVDSEDLQLLSSLKKQLIWLKLSYTAINDSSIRGIAQLINLTRLSLDHTSISDTAISSLKALPALQYLNLVATKVTAKGVLQLAELKSLRSLFLYQSAVEKADWATIQKALPQTKIDSGNYQVETLSTDTIIVKAKK